MSTVAAASKPVGWWTGLRRTEGFWALLFLSPWLIGFAVFTAGPMVASFLLSLTDYDVLNEPAFVGLANYAELFRDERLVQSLWNTFFYAALHVPLSMLVALALAMLLERATRGAHLFRTVFYLPSITPSPPACCGCGCSTRRSAWSTAAWPCWASKARAGRRTRPGSSRVWS